MNRDFSKIIQLQKNQKLCIINMPIPFRGDLLDKLPEGVTVTPRPVGEFDTIILFTNTEEELTLSWDRLFSKLVAGGTYWIAYPDKKSELYNEITKAFIDDFTGKKDAIAGNVIAFLPGWKAVEINNTSKPS
jgi:hypothetical protein